MLVRRIGVHVKEQNWFAVGLDVAIVFVGVFIGLQADTWNETRISKAEAKTYYARLIEDLRAEESIRLGQIAYYQRTKQYGEAALRSLQQADRSLGEQFLIDVYQATQVWNYSTQRTTYDELLSGSIANAIPDATLRQQLANYYVALEISEQRQLERTPFRGNLRGHMPHAVQGAVRKNCGDRFTFQRNYVMQLRLPESCELALDSQLVSEAVDALGSYANLEFDLTRHLADVEGKLVSLESYLPPTRELIELLEEISQ